MRPAFCRAGQLLFGFKMDYSNSKKTVESASVMAIRTQCQVAETIHFLERVRQEAIDAYMHAERARQLINNSRKEIDMLSRLHRKVFFGVSAEERDPSLVARHE